MPDSKLSRINTAIEEICEQLNELLDASGEEALRRKTVLLQEEHELQTEAAQLIEDQFNAQMQPLLEEARRGIDRANKRLETYTGTNPSSSDE